MPGFVVSVVLQCLEQIDSELGGMEVHGANLGISHVLKKLIADPRLDVIEFFLPPAEYQRRDTMGIIAGNVLPEHLRGQGMLRFYPTHALPEVWQDAVPRILLSVDLTLIGRDRYLRDRYAQAATPIWAMTHGMGHQDMYEVMRHVASAERVPYDTIGCLSNACKDHISATFKGYVCPADAPEPFRLEYFPNTVDTEQFQPSSLSRQQDARRLLRLPLEGTITLYLGRITPNSKADLLPLVRQFSLVAGPTDHLVCAGVENTPGYLARLKQEADTHGIGDRFLAINKVDPWSRSLYYTAADVFVCPSDNIQECMSNTVLEAMSSGLPTIVTEWDGMRDMVVEGETGYLIDTAWMPGLGRVEEMGPASPFMVNFLLLAQNVWTDNDRLRDCLEKLLESRELRLTMGACGRQRILDLFIWEQASKKLFGYWESMMEDAMTESSSVREARRLKSGDLGLPIPFLDAFENYATRRADPNLSKVRLSIYGNQIVAGKAKLAFYDETLPLIRSEVVDGLFDALRKQASLWASMKELACGVSELTKQSEDTVLFHIGLLVKREVLEITFN